MSNGEPPAATIAAAPPELPPGVRSRSYGFDVRPKTSLSVSSDHVNSGVFVLPSTIAPAALIRATTVASRSGTRSRQPTVPAVVRRPAVSSESLIVHGTPWSGPAGSPRRSLPSASRARSSASGASVTTALSAGLTTSIRSRHARTTSTDDTSRSRISAANWVTGCAQSSSDIAPPRPARSCRPASPLFAVSGLDREDLVQPPPVPRLAGERRAEERDRALPRRLRSDHSRAEGQHVHVVVLHALVGRVRVVADGAPDAANLVRRDARADARAADQDAPIRFTVADRKAEPLGEIRIVVLRVRAIAAEVDRLVAEAARRRAGGRISSLRAAPA